jgi:hypothetical protein
VKLCDGGKRMRKALAAEIKQSRDEHRDLEKIVAKIQVNAYRI